MSENTAEKNIYETPENFREALAKMANPEPVPEPVVPVDIQQAEAQAKTQEPIAAPEAPVPEQTEASEVSASDEVVDAPIISSTVPKSRFNQELERKKALALELQREREERIRLEERLRALEVKVQVPAEEEVPLDDVTYNKVKHLEEELNYTKQQTQQQLQQVYAMNIAQAQQDAFMKQNPDFMDALEHVKNVETNVAYSFGADELTAPTMVHQKMSGIVQTALNQGKNAAETVYNIAKQYGYQPKSQAVKATPAARTPNLEAISNNMQKSQTISNIGNAAAVGERVPTDIKYAVKDGHVDPDLFRKMLAAQKQAAGIY